MVAKAVPSTRRFSNWAVPSFFNLKKIGCQARFSLWQSEVIGPQALCGNTNVQRKAGLLFKEPQLVHTYQQADMLRMSQRHKAKQTR